MSGPVAAESLADVDAPMKGAIRGIWQRYLNSLLRNPLETKAVTAGVLAGVSDVLAQRISGEKRVAVRRTLLMMAFGCVYAGPSAHYMHKLLDYLFHSGKDTGTAVKKVVVEQLTYGPLCNVLFMAYISLVVEGRPLGFLQQKLRADYPAVQLNGWKVWPLAALINYKYVGIQYRVLFVNIVALFWSTFLILRSRTAAKLKAT